MHCENIYCVFCETGHCNLKNIHLDITGSCLDCEYLPLSSYELAVARKRYWEENDLPFSKLKEN